MGQSGQEVSHADPIDPRVRQHSRQQLPSHSNSGQVSPVRTESGVPHPERVLLGEHRQVPRLRETREQIWD